MKNKLNHLWTEIQFIWECQKILAYELNQSPRLIKIQEEQNSNQYFM